MNNSSSAQMIQGETKTDNDHVKMNHCFRPDDTFSKEKNYFRTDYFDFLRVSDLCQNIEQLAVGVIALDKKGVIKSTNETAAQFLGHQKPDLIHTDFLSFVHPEDRKKFIWEDTSKPPLPSRDAEIRLMASGETIWIRMNITLSAHDGSVQLMFYDITETKVLEQENAILKQMLRQDQHQKIIGEFSTGIVHDFNNILHAIIGSLFKLRKTTSQDEEYKRTLQAALTATKRAAHLVRQILNFGNQADFKATPVKIQGILREAIELSRYFRPSNIIIVRTIDDRCKPVMADPTHIHQIAMNLITNALQAMGPTKGVLGISLKEMSPDKEMLTKMKLNPGPFCRISVSDTGKGIKKTIQEKIFEPHFTTQNNGNGTGLGLYLISNITKQYGGGINFSSEPGKGTQFDIFLPLCDEPHPPENRPITASSVKS